MIMLIFMATIAIRSGNHGWVPSAQSPLSTNALFDADPDNLTMGLMLRLEADR